MFYDKPPERRCRHRNSATEVTEVDLTNPSCVLVSIKEIVHDIVENHSVVDEVVLLWH